MPAQLYLGFDFDGFYIAPEDIKWGEAETADVALLINRTLAKVSLRRFSLDITIRGIKQNQARPYIKQADRAARQAARGSIEIRDIDVGPRTLESAMLTEANYSTPIRSGSVTIIEELTLSYESTVFI